METVPRICLITGATSGLGKATATELARQGMHIIFTTRDESKGKTVRDEMINLTGNQRINTFFCDLSSFRSVCDFANHFQQNFEHLDILINNAGIWTNRKIITSDGIESQFQVNYLAPFLLTHLLLNMVKKSAAGRIINVSSGIHYHGHMNISDPEFKNEPYRSVKAYTQSKLGNILFTRKLASGLKDSNITVNCLAPGWVNTGLFRDSGIFVRLSARLMALTPTRGAETTIFLATSDKVKNITGEYFEKKQIKKSSRQSYDQDLSKRLWKLSEDYLKDYLNY